MGFLGFNSGLVSVNNPCKPLIPHYIKEMGAEGNFVPFRAHHLRLYSVRRLRAGGYACVTRLISMVSPGASATRRTVMPSFSNQ